MFFIFLQFYTVSGIDHEAFTSLCTVFKILDYMYVYFILPYVYFIMPNNKIFKKDAVPIPVDIL